MTSSTLRHFEARFSPLFTLDLWVACSNSHDLLFYCMINVALLPTQSYLKCLEILFLENFCQILPKLSHIWNKIYRLVIPKLTIFFEDEDYRSCYERKHRQIVCLQEKKIFFSSLINSFMGLPGLPHSVSVLCTPKSENRLKHKKQSSFSY